MGGVEVFRYDRITAVVGGVLANVLMFLCPVDHGHQRHAEVDSQTVDVEETEERQRREHQSA